MDITPVAHTHASSTPIKAPLRLLVDTRPIKLDLVEDASKSGKLVMRGEFAKCGVATENKRVYPQKLWEREITRLRRLMDERGVYGRVDHPVDSRSTLDGASHFITNLEIRNGVVYGEAEILNTTKGKDLRAILEAGGKVGISSRGHGSTRMNERGEDVVQDDYRLSTFDFVADPADQDAYPQMFYEARGNMGRTEEEMAAEFAKQIETAKKEGRDTAEASLKEEFAKELTARLGELRAQVTESVRGELLADPSVAGAKTALEAIKSVLRPFVLPEDARTVTEAKDAEIAQLQNKLAEQSLRIKELEESESKLKTAAKEAGYKFFVERSIAGDADAELIRKLIGDVTRFEDSNQLKEAIQAARQDLAQKREDARKLSEQIEAEKAKERERKDKERKRALAAEKALREENEKLREALNKSSQVNKVMILRNYAESRLANHPKAAKIRPLIESTNPQSQEEIDQILSQFREPLLDSAQSDDIRARVRNLTRGGEGPTPVVEETAVKVRSNGPFANLGVDLDTIRTLSGMGDLRLPNRKS